MLFYRMAAECSDVFRTGQAYIVDGWQKIDLSGWWRRDRWGAEHG